MRGHRASAHECRGCVSIAPGGKDGVHINNSMATAQEGSTNVHLGTASEKGANAGPGTVHWALSI